MQAQEAVLVEAADVAGVEPAVAQHLAVERVIAEIARHNRRATHADLAALARR